MNEPALEQETVAALLESVGGDWEFVQELFATFTEETPALVAAVEASLEGKDFESLKHAAHTLKSTSASLGALRLSAVSRDLEQAGRTGELPPADLVAELRRLVAEALAAMASMPEGG